jgi:hypothetical protein
MIDDNLTVMVRRLQRYANDPMWDSHAEVPKILLGEAIEALNEHACSLKLSNDINANLRTANDRMRAALEQWPCPGCGGRGIYHQNKSGELRDAERGRKSDPKFSPGPQTCKVCDGNGFHPTASAGLAASTTGSAHHFARALRESSNG